jgi:HEAT repeat protein
LHRLQPYQTNAAKAVALLTIFANDPDSRVRWNAFVELQPYQTNAAEAVAFFVPLLKDPDRHVASYAAGRLGKYDTNALDALPDMVAMLQTAPGWEQYAVGEAIFNLDRPLAQQVLTNGIWTYACFERREKQAAEYKRFLEESKQKKKQRPGTYH